MLHGRERLVAWIARSKVNQREAARILGLDHTYLNQILSGKRVPGLANAVKIETVTGIAVEAWVPTEVGTEDEPEPVRVGNARMSKA